MGVTPKGGKNGKTVIDPFPDFVMTGHAVRVHTRAAVAGVGVVEGPLITGRAMI